MLVSLEVSRLFALRFLAVLTSPPSVLSLTHHLLSVGVQAGSDLTSKGVGAELPCTEEQGSETPAPQFSPGHSLDHEVGTLPYHAGGQRAVPLTLWSFPNGQCWSYALLELGNSPPSHSPFSGSLLWNRICSARRHKVGVFLTDPREPQDSCPSTLLSLSGDSTIWAVASDKCFSSSLSFLSFFSSDVSLFRLFNSAEVLC